MPTINLGRVRGNDGDTNVDTVVEYTEPLSYEEPASGDAIRTLFAKIAKGLSELFSNKIDKSNISKNFATTDWGQVAAAPLVKELKEDVGALNDALPKRSKMEDYKDETTVTNCVCGSFKYLKCGNILFFTASFATTIATPSAYAIRFTLPYAVRDAEASIFSTMASGGGVNDVVSYGNINSNSITVNIHGTHGTGYVFYVQGYIFCDD